MPTNGISGQPVLGSDVLDALSAHVAVLGADGTILMVNRAWRAFAAENPPEPPHGGVGVNYLAVCDASDGADAETGAAVAAGIRAVLGGRTTLFELEYPCHTPAGERWFVVRVTPYGGPECAGAVVAHEDVTARHVAAARLRESEARLRAVVDHAAEAILTVGPDDCVKTANAAANRLFGCTSGALVGRVLGGLDGSVAGRSDSGLLVGAGAAARARRLDGTTTPVDVSVGLIPDTGEAVVLLRDATMARALTAAKDGLVAAAAHDLAGPLTYVRGYLELLRARLAGGEAPTTQLVDALTRAEAAAADIDRQVAELRDLAALELGRPLGLLRGPTDLVALARRVAARAQDAHPGHAVTVATAETALVGLWDESRLLRALENLVGNAVKYSPGGGPVTVMVARECDTAIVAVADRGIGIPARELPHVFERFRRASNAPSTALGVGIGLASVRMIVEEHGGKASIESAEGAGTRATIRLPLAIRAINAP